MIEKTHLDLFSGIGGFAIAAQNCGYKTIGFCEKEPYAQQILKQRFGAVLADAESQREHGEHGDTGGAGSSRHKSKPKPASRVPRLHDNIFTLNGADYAGVDLLTGGFPCQPFSVAGKRLGAADDRAIWPEMLRVIREAKPTWIIGENVAGIVTMELDNILSDLEGIGYSAWPLVIPACAVDARHRRDRVWIVAHADNQRSELPKRLSGNEGSPERDLLGGQGEDVAHADEPGSQGRHGAELRERGGERIAGQGGSQGAAKDVSNAPMRINSAIGTRSDERGLENSDGTAPERCCNWLPEPELGRVAHGIPHRAHRLRGLGNAIVPQVAEEIIRNLQY